ncbi:hypothetical protein FACS1894130_12230 [Spirochaetia bacterium]|nr:hypothetical protein FACS1894130_12230 [Spirochaetia bacterium]
MNVVSMRNTIRDSKLMGINITYTEDDINISILLEKNDISRILTIQQVESYELNCYNQQGYSYIERVKIVETANGFYISLDPYDETVTPNENDNDCITAKYIDLKELENAK